MILGFAEDYHRIIVDYKHELILTIGITNTNADLQVLHVPAAGATAKQFKVSLLQTKWTLRQACGSKKNSTAQTNCQGHTYFHKFSYMGILRKLLNNSANKNAGHFDHCNIRNIKLFLNSQSYTYENLNLGFSHNQYALIYDIYMRFSEHSSRVRVSGQFFRGNIRLLPDSSRLNRQI